MPKIGSGYADASIQNVLNMNVQNLYLDSNSIIYDSIRSSDKSNIINSVCLKIEEYIYTIYPKDGEPLYISIYDVFKDECVFVGTAENLLRKYAEVTN